MYSKETADRICDQLADGLSLREICRQEGMPNKSTVMRWLHDDLGFRDQYARAKEIGVEAIAEDILDIADDGANDWMERYDKDGGNVGWTLNGEHVQRSRVRIDARKWLLSKLAPKKYGDRTVLAGDPEAPLTHDHTVRLPTETVRFLEDLSAGTGDSGSSAPVQK